MDDEDDQKRTVWCGNLSSKCTEELIYELFLQVAPLQNVNLCVDQDGRKNSYAFITFKHIESVDYSINLLNGIELFNRKIIVRPTNSNNTSREEKPNTSDQFDRSIKASSTPYNKKHEYRNYYKDRQSERYNHYSRYKDNHSYNERSRYENSYRVHPYSRDRKTRFDTDNSYKKS